MHRTITLNEQEANLRQLLLDVSNYIGTLEGYRKPVLRITGGWVRDKLLGLQSKDIDIGIDTMTGFKFGTLMQQYLHQPETKAKYQQDSLGRLAKIEANPEKSKHLETVTTRILGLEIDLVNLRKENYTEDSRNPTMEFGTPTDDALRRDATINALFYNLSTEEVEDFTGRGLQDLKRKIIKTPLAPLQTFTDDPLRVLRCIRFASRFNYQIAAEDEAAMSHSSIRDELRKKITRERVGVEITKMLKGTRPHTALCLIDKLGLYNEIFTTHPDHSNYSVPTTHWKRAYDQLLAIVQARSGDSGTSPPLRDIASILLRDSDDTFLAWMLVCFVPWADTVATPQERPNAKRLPFPASVAAREGIKADNRVCAIVDNAVSQRHEILKLKDVLDDDDQPSVVPSSRKLNPSYRESQGQAIRSWGSHWRSSALYSLLTDVTKTESQTEIEILLNGYAVWLLRLRALDLLDVSSLKPIVNGTHLSKALGIKSGPWMREALEIAMAWQLRYPKETDPAGAIAEVLEWKKAQDE